jgi:hypothetical protein
MAVFERATPQTRATVCLLMLAAVAMGTSGCAAGDPRFSLEDPAGFWMGLWHGAIGVITLVFSFFDDAIGVYERNNSGSWYDFGFIIGLTVVWGHSHHMVRKRRRTRDKQWEEIGQQIEAEIKQHIAQWADAEPDEDWDEIGPKAEKKLKSKLREWAKDGR